jgi:hypothetical protein
VQQAQPLRFEGDVLVFGVAPQMLGAARDRFRSQADIVREALSDKLGHRFKFKLEPAPQFALDGPSGSAPAESALMDAGDEAPHEDGRAPDAEPPPEVVDTEDLTEVPPETDPPPVNRLRDELGATVVEEVPRER